MTITSKGLPRIAFTTALTLLVFLAAPSAKADERMDKLIVCSAIFNASFALSTTQALKEEYQSRTLAYAEAALMQANELGVDEAAFRQRASELGAATSITEDSLPAERSRCLNGVPVETQ